MVDNIFEDEDFFVSLPTPGVSTNEMGVSKINLPPTREGAREDLEGNLGGEAVIKYIGEALTNYPKTFDVADPTGTGVFRTQEEKDESSVSLSPMYGKAADLAKNASDFVKRVDETPSSKLMPGIAIPYVFSKFVIGPDFYKILGKAEMNQDLEPMEGLEFWLVVADGIGIATGVAKGAFNAVTKALMSKGVPEKTAITQTTNLLTREPDIVNRINELDDDQIAILAQDRSTKFSSGQPTTTKTTGALTTKDEIFGLGDDLRAPKQVDEPVLKQEPSPAKLDEVEGPTTIDDVLEATQENLSRKKAFEGMKPEDIIGKGEEPKDPFLTPDEPIATPMTRIEEIKAKKETKTTAANDPTVVELQTQVPKFLSLSEAEKQVVASKFMNIMFSPAKKKALFEKLSKNEIVNLNNYIKRKKLATSEMLELSNKISKEFSPSFGGRVLDSDDQMLTMFENIQNWKNSPDGKMDKTGYSLSGENLRTVMAGDDPALYDVLTKENRARIVNQLRDDLNNIGLTDIASPGDKIKIPQSKSAREMLTEMDRLTFPEGFDFINSGLIDASQKINYNQAVRKVVSSLNDKGEGYLANAATGFIEKTLNRMLRQATNKDIPLEEIFKKVNSIDADGIADIISRRQKYNNKIQEFLGLDYDVDFAEIGHVKAIAEDALLALDIDNLALQSAKANGAEFKLRNKIKNILKNPDDPNTPDKLDEVVKELTDLGISTKVGDTLYGTARNIEDELKALEIGASDAVFGTYAKGGIVEERPAGPGLPPQDLDIFQDDLPEGSYETANLMLPFFKLFGKAPVNEVAPIPTPKDKLVNPTKKQKESLEREKEIRSQEDIFDPTPDERVEIGTDNPIEVTPLTNQPMTSVFYSDIERAMTNAPDQFANKQELLDFLNKNRIKKSEVDDYRINALLRLYDDNMPIPKGDILSQVRSAPISGMRVHATGQGSEMINPNGVSRTRYEGYAKDGFIEGSQRERILYLDRNKLPGDSGEYPQSMFGGEQIFRHEFGMPNESDTYVIGWTRLTDRYGFIPPKVEGPQTKINVSKLTKEKTKNERSLQGLYAEARSKIERLANQRGMSQAEIFDIMADFGSDTPKLSVIAKYADQLDEISPGLVNQMDELVVKNRDLQEQITKGSGVDPSGVVRVTFADEIQSDLLQAAAMRKQQLTAALRKIQEEGNTTNLQGLNRLAEATMDFYEKNKSVFRPLKKTDAEVNVLAQRVTKMDEEVDEIVNQYIQTREVSDADLSRLSTLLNDNLDTMMKELIDIDSNAIDGLFPDLPFKNRDEWADALVKKDLYELAYRKFVLKDPDASSYYAVSPSKYVIDRYRFQGNAATSAADRAADKQRRFDAFKRNGEFRESQYKGIGMDEFYGGPDSVSNVIDNSGTAATNPNFGKPKHYTSTLETILKKQAQSNNSEMITMPVQVKSGRGATQYRVTDQNGNMVATLTNEDQARQLLVSNPNYRIQPISIPNKKDMEPVFAIKITPEMLEPYKTHKAQGGLVEHIDIFEVA